MNVTRGVIMDLLPVYLAGEAGSETRALIEEFMKQDPAFALTVEKQKIALGTESESLKAGNDALPRDLELQTLAKTHSMIERRGWFLALALMFTAFPFSFQFDKSSFTFLLVRDVPMLALACWAAAVVFWILHIRIRRQLRNIGL